MPFINKSFIRIKAEWQKHPQISSVDLNLTEKTNPKLNLILCGVDVADLSHLKKESQVQTQF